MKYIDLIQPLAQKLVLGGAFCQTLLSTMTNEIKSSTQQFETSTLGFNLYTSYFPLASV